MVKDSIENYKTKPVKITKEIAEYIAANKNALIEKGIAKRVDNFCQCIECGKESNVYLTVKNDGSTSMCLDCAVGITLDKSIEINCAMAKEDSVIKRMDCFK